MKYVKLPLLASNFSNNSSILNLYTEVQMHRGLDNKIAYCNYLWGNISQKQKSCDRRVCFSTWENCLRFKIHTSLLNVGWSGYWTSCLELPLVLVNWIHWYAVQLEFLQISLGKRKGHLVTCIAPKTLCFTVKLQQQTSGSHLLLWQTCDWFLTHHIALTTVIKYLSLFGTWPIIGLHSETIHIF